MEEENLFSNILSKLNEDELKSINYLIYDNGSFIYYNSIFKKEKKEKLSLLIKIKKNRKKIILKAIEEANKKNTIIFNNKYVLIIEIEKEKNYIILEYVVDSHVIIPKSILMNFSYKNNNINMVDYINMDNMRIKSENIKKYGTIYGYYNLYIEEKLSSDYENKFGLIKEKIYQFSKGKKKRFEFNPEIVKDFFDMTFYRNPKLLEEVNKSSIYADIIKGFNPSEFLKMRIDNKLSEFFEKQKVGIIVNETNRNLVINETMINPMSFDNGNIVYILPISEKAAFVLMEDDYYKKWCVDDELYYMKINNENDVFEINKQIYLSAKENNENVIGNRKELESLLSNFEKIIM